LTAATAGTGNTASAPKTIASYCSPSGDVCYGILNRSGKVYLEITTAARYFNRYTLCVRRLPPRSTAEYAQRCGSFPVFRQSGSTWGSRVNYARQYPLKFAGAYRVTWKLSGKPLGPALRFRLPLS
jgi:hypothetical protein